MVRFLVLALCLLFAFPTQAQNAKRFKTIWLEPGSLLYDGRVRATTSADLLKLVKRYKQMGIDTVVLAYSEMNGVWYYNASSNIRNAYPAATSNYTLSGNLNPYFLEEFLNHAQAQSLNVIVGLSQFGDALMTQRLETDMAEAAARMETDPNKIFKPENVAAMNTFVNRNKLMITDLNTKFGTKISGFYLTQEPHCLDVAMNGYNGILDHIKALPGAVKKVMISPNADAEPCYQGMANTQYEAALKHRAYVSFMKSRGIDIIAYQDSIGCGFQAGILLYKSYGGAWRSQLAASATPSINVCHYNDIGRSMRISYLQYLLFPMIKMAYQTTDPMPEFWINTELWRMNGGTCGYGCAYPSGTFSAQLNTWYDNGFGQKLMLNEGLKQFTFPEINNPLNNTGTQGGNPAASSNQASFTSSYLAAIGVNLTPAPP